MRKFIFFIFSVGIIFFLWQNLSGTAKGKDVFCQGGTFVSLYAGNYNQVATVGEIKKKGDFGLGVFDLLDGSMVILDGAVYQADSRGGVTKVKNDAGSPFYAVTNFKVDSEKELGEIKTFSQLCQRLDGFRKRDDVIYAVRIEGTFPQIKTAAFSRQYYPYPTLQEAAKEQAIFQYENISGVLVGFWLPDCVGTINQPGYHFHFLSGDKQKGGHVLEVEIENGLAQFDEMIEMNISFSGVMTVPPSEEDLTVMAKSRNCIFSKTETES